MRCALPTLLRVSSDDSAKSTDACTQQAHWQRSLPSKGHTGLAKTCALVHPGCWRHQAQHPSPRAALEACSAVKDLAVGCPTAGRPTDRGRLLCRGPQSGATYTSRSRLPEQSHISSRVAATLPGLKSYMDMFRAHVSAVRQQGSEQCRSASALMSALFLQPAWLWVAQLHTG